MKDLKKYTDLAKKQVLNKDRYSDSKVKFGELRLEWDGTYLAFCFDDSTIRWDDGMDLTESVSTRFTCAYKTPKGYISSKKIGVDVNDFVDVTEAEAIQLLKFETDAVKNTFDPFYKEKKAKAKNAAAWVHIAANHLQPDTRG